MVYPSYLSQQQDFDYDSFVWELLENQPKALPHIRKLTIQHEHYPKTTPVDQHDYCKYFRSAHDTVDTGVIISSFHKDP